METPDLGSLSLGARLMQPEEPKFPKDNHLNEKISLVRRDITKLEVDAIVNAGEWDTDPLCCPDALCVWHRQVPHCCPDISLVGVEAPGSSWD